jgi:cell division protein FtsB
MAKRKKINIIGCALLLLLLVLCVEAAKQEYRLNRLSQEVVAAQKRVDELNRQKKELTNQQKRINDPSYIEKIAREDYNMVKKEELPVVVKE